MIYEVYDTNIRYALLKSSSQDYILVPKIILGPIKKGEVIDIHVERLEQPVSSALVKKFK